MNTPKDYAYPTPDCSQLDGASRTFGMTKRELFAGMAMQAMLSNKKTWGDISLVSVKREDIPAFFAVSAVQMADALIARLEEKP